MAIDDSWQLRGLCRGNHSHLFFPPSTFERKDERRTARVESAGHLPGMPGDVGMSRVRNADSRTVRNLGWIHGK